MSNVNGKTVKSATMHANIFYPGVGEIRKELSNVDSGLTPAIKMTLDEPFLVLETKGKAGNKPVTILVPITNLASLVLE